jgi:hypothetical protein
MDRTTSAHSSPDPGTAPGHAEPNPGQPDPGTWNTPEAIAEHRALSAGERIALAVQLSRTAMKLAAAERLDGR